MISNVKDPLDANEIKQGMEYVGGVKNTKVSAAAITHGMSTYPTKNC
jgi:copper chaperone CopZ